LFPSFFDIDSDDVAHGRMEAGANASMEHVERAAVAAARRKMDFMAMIWMNVCELKSVQSAACCG
jgi:hypothetical protein